MAEVTVLVGTTKGVFLIDPAGGVTGPHCGGWPINHVIGDAGSGQIWAAGGNDWWGAGVWRSGDGGASWTLAKLSNGKFDAMLRDQPELAAHLGIEPAPPAPFTGHLDAIWSLHRAGGVLYAGTKPASLYASLDDGATWAEVTGLRAHPSWPSWEPGAAGLILHTILSDPEDGRKLWVGISAAGVFATEDGGTTWERRNRLDNAASGHDPAPEPGHDHGGEVGHCVHNMARAAGDLLYQQNHHGVFRSGDGGRSWADISAGLPSRFGFPIALHPENPAMIWTLPLNGDMQGRYPPDARALVWRSADGGETWQGFGEGLPARNCFFTVLRQAMAVGRGPEPGLYFGTNSGSVFCSRDLGESWTSIADHLPTVLSVETLQARS